MERRVVITGIGPVTPAGIGKKEFWNSVSNGISPVKRAHCVDVSHYGDIQTAEIVGFNLDKTFSRDIHSGNLDRKVYNRIKQDCDKAIQFAVAGAKLALYDSGLQYDRLDNSIGIIIGNAEDCIQTQEEKIKHTIQKINKKIFDDFNSMTHLFAYFKVKKAFRECQALLEPEKLDEFIKTLHDRYGTIHSLVPVSTVDLKSYAIPSRIASFFGLHGPAFSVNTACASGLDAIGQAFMHIKSGVCDLIVSGGSEAPITLESIAVLDNLGVLSKTKPRPYDSRRDGFAIGEGAGIVVLEEFESAKTRNAPVYAEIVGYAQTIDGNRNILALDPKGKYLKSAIKSALKNSNIPKEAIGYINSHGTSTPSCDEIETLVVKHVFENHASSLHMSSTKPITGHSIGAVGGIETILTAMAIQNSLVPPTLNLEIPSPGCDLNYAPGEAVEKNIDAALVSSMGFGGYNSALVLKKI